MARSKKEETETDSLMSEQRNESKNAAQHSPASHVASATVFDVQPTWGTRRVFRQCSGLKAGSVKVVLSRPAHATRRVTPAVGQP
jgi:hypothetical protein